MIKSIIKPTFTFNKTPLNGGLSNCQIGNTINNTKKQITCLNGDTKEEFEIKKTLFLEIKKFIFNGKEIDNKTKEYLEKVTNFCFSKYRGMYRNNGDTTITHLFRTALYTIKDFENPSIEKIVVALLHDIIEDGFATAKELSNLFGEKITLMVLALSKNNYHRNKEKRDKEYFGRYESKETMICYLKKMMIFLNIYTDTVYIDEMVQTIFDVKCADRCHNLCTQWDPNGIQKIFYKINETFYYLTDIAEKHNPIALRIMLLYINKLYYLEIKMNGKTVGTLSQINWKMIKEQLEIDFSSKDFDVSF